LVVLSLLLGSASWFVPLLQKVPRLCPSPGPRSPKFLDSGRAALPLKGLFLWLRLKEVSLPTSSPPLPWTLPGYFGLVSCSCRSFGDNATAGISQPLTSDLTLTILTRVQWSSISLFPLQTSGGQVIRGKREQPASVPTPSIGVLVSVEGGAFWNASDRGCFLTAYRYGRKSLNGRNGEKHLRCKVITKRQTKSRRNYGPEGRGGLEAVLKEGIRAVKRSL